jgi:AcrR family transcriptional regulator
MPRGFTNNEKERIRRELLRRGREHFARYGLKKTSVDDLARLTGIAKGSFYKFFPSKEALFMAIHVESEQKLRVELLRHIEDIQDPAEKLRTFLKDSFALMEKDPVLLTVLQRGSIDNLSDFMASGPYEEHFKHNMDFMTDLVKTWQREGVIRALDPEVVSNLLGSLFFVFMQRAAIGEKMYTEMTDMMVEALVGYLVLAR